jgi:ABC-type lipoprotein release transport system permease subunit
MSLLRLVLREISFRYVGFILSVLATAAAVATLVALPLYLRAFDLRTIAQLQAKDQDLQAYLLDKEKEIEESGKQLQDDIRKQMLELKFHIIILPRDQNLSDFHSANFADKVMPEEYATRLANSRVVTVNHLLPTLQQKILWKEQERQILLTGVRGEIPILHQKQKKPLLQHVPMGTMVLGHELHRSLKLKEGDRVQLQDREFKVHKLNPQRGNVEDITIWINLSEAQEILGKKGKINSILAVECDCGADRLDKVRAEVEAILPDTQVLELHSVALTRAEARKRAESEAKSNLAREQKSQQELIDKEREHQAQLRTSIQGTGLLLNLALAIGSVAVVGLLTWLNVRDRREEIGILRAMGITSIRILMVLLMKAVLVGVLAAVVGYGAGALAVAFSEPQHGPKLWWQPLLIGQLLLAAPLLCVLASWLPAILAVRQDPAEILRPV